MSEIVVYGIPGSPYVRSVQLGLEEKRAPWRMEVMTPSTMRGEEHKLRHPFGRIPVIDHDDFRLYETQAILRYLDATFPEPALQPSAPRAIGRMNQIIGINDWYLFPKVSAVIVFNRIVGPVLMGMTPNEAAISDALPVARTCLDELSQLLGDQPFMAGPELTLADLMLAPQIDFLAATREGQDLLRGSPLSDWLARMNQRPSMQRTQRPANLQAAA